MWKLSHNTRQSPCVTARGVLPEPPTFLEKRFFSKKFPKNFLGGAPGPRTRGGGERWTDTQSKNITFAVLRTRAVIKQAISLGPVQVLCEYAIRNNVQTANEIIFSLVSLTFRGLLPLRPRRLPMNRPTVGRHSDRNPVDVSVPPASAYFSCAKSNSSRLLGPRD